MKKTATPLMPTKVNDWITPDSEQCKGHDRGEVNSRNSLRRKGLREPLTRAGWKERRKLSTIVKTHDTLRGSMPSFFIRAIKVVRLRPMRAAAPSGPATR